MPASGYVTLYHSTSARNAAAITAEGFAPKYAPGTEAFYVSENSQYGFFSRRPGAQAGYGDTVIAVQVKASAVDKDPWSGELRVKISDLPKAPAKYSVYEKPKRKRRKK